MQYSDGPSVGQMMKNYRISYATIWQPIVQGCKAVIVGAMVIGHALRSMRRFGVMPGEYRHPAGLFAALCHNAFVWKRGKCVYALGKTRRSFRLKQSYVRHSFSVNARVYCARARKGVLAGWLIGGADIKRYEKDRNRLLIKVGGFQRLCRYNGVRLARQAV